MKTEWYGRVSAYPVPLSTGAVAELNGFGKVYPVVEPAAKATSVGAFGRRVKAVRRFWSERCTVSAGMARIAGLRTNDITVPPNPANEAKRQVKTARSVD